MCVLLCMFYLKCFVFEVLSELLFSQGVRPHSVHKYAAFLFKMVSKI